MKRKLILLIFILFCINEVIAQNTDFSQENIDKIGLKVIHIETENNEEPECEFAEAPEGCMGMTSINAKKVKCRIYITLKGDTLYDSGMFEKNQSGATIKINGNTSAYFAIPGNYPYKIKLQKKADLLNRNNERFDDKEWRLINDGYTLNTIIGLKISELLQFSWTPAYTPCNVFINGDYRGCYLLIESVKRNKDCRINVDKTSGYIVERDPYWWKENRFFTTNYFASSKGYRWTWKYPDEDDVLLEQEDYITQFINDTEQSILNGTYSNYIDIKSFAKWILAHDILGSKDSGGTNLYVAKYDDTPNSLLEMQVLWDFDSNFRMEPGEFSKCHNNAGDFYFYNLFNNTNNSFTSKYKELWLQIKPTLLSTITQYILSITDSEYGRALESSRMLHYNRWGYTPYETIGELAQEAINWFNNHLDKLDVNINKLADNTSISAIKTKEKYDVYNLLGNKVYKPKKGIYIKNKRKIIYH
jgi:hypothetical protein